MSTKSGFFLVKMTLLKTGYFWSKPFFSKNDREFDRLFQI